MTTTSLTWNEYGFAPHPAGSEQKKNAEVLFAKATRTGLIDRLKDILGSRLEPLAQLNFRPSAGGQGQTEQKGPRTIALRDICGSVNPGRTRDFDAAFHPLTNHSKERWTGIANARRDGHRLPRVSLVEANGVYYVKDGHHRVSVAHALCDSDIEANVTAWLC
jgi:hypothetical protein